MDQPRRVDPTSGPSPFGDVDSDAELLKAFAAATPGSASAQAVLTQIVARHGTMVYQVAQRMVCDPTLVDDVFQATFLVLAQSARKIQKSASLTSWLHGTARNIGRRALNDKYGVRSQTTTGVEMVTAVEDDPFTEMIRSHERQLLDEELQQLPEIYRAPLVLHYFEQRSNQEISQWLGVTVAAVESRLKRAKQLLRARLVRRGMTLSVAVAALGASSSLATATPSVALVSSTITLAATTPAITASLTTVAASAVLQLAGKELATMSAASKITALLLTTAGTLTLGGAVLFGAAYGGLTGEGPKTGQRANGIDPVITDEPEFNALEQIHEPVLLASGENTPKTTVEGSSDALKTALKREVQFDIPETTLKEALEKLSDKCGVTFVVPHPEELGASLNSRVKLVANGAPLGSVLEEMLANVDGKKLRYGIVQGALAIDSADNLGGTTTFMERMQYDSGKGWKTLPPQAKRFSAAVSEALPKASADANQTTPHTDSADFAEKVKRDTQKIRDALDQVTTFEFKETPLKEAIASMSEKCGISIKLDTQSLKDAGINEDTPIDLVVEGITLRSSLKLMLENVDGKALDYLPEHGVLVVGTAERIQIGKAKNTSNIVRSESKSPTADEAQLPSKQDSSTVITGNNIQVTTKDMQFTTKELRVNGTLPNQSGASSPNNRAPIVAGIRNLDAADRKVYDALDQEASLNFAGTPLEQALEELRTQHKVNIWTDLKSLEDEGVNLHSPVYAQLSKVPLRTGLSLMLEKVGDIKLDFYVDRGVLCITTAEKTGEIKSSRTYNLAGGFRNIFPMAEAYVSEIKEANPGTLDAKSQEGSLVIEASYATHEQIEDHIVKLVQAAHTRNDSNQNIAQVDSKGVSSDTNVVSSNGASLLGDTGSEHRAPIVSAIRNLSTADRRVYQALDQTTRLEFPDNPIQEVFDFVAELHDIRIRFDRRSLEDEGVNLESRVKCVIGDVSLRTALPLILDSAEGVKLDYYVDGGILFITTEDAVNHKKSLRFYDLSSELVNLPEVIEEYAENFEANGSGTLELTSLGDCLAIETSFAIHKKLEEMIVGVMQVAEARKAAGKEFFIPEPKPALTRPAPVQPAPSTGEQQQPAGAVGGSGTTGTAPAGNAGGGFIGGGSGGFN